MQKHKRSRQPRKLKASGSNIENRVLRNAEGVIVASQYGPSPPRICTKGANYVELYSTGALATTVGAQTYFIINSLYAPTSGGGSGSQPYGYTASSSIYNKYRVLSVEIDIEFGQNSSAIPMLWAFSVTNGVFNIPVTNLTTFEEFSSIPRTRRGFISSTNPIRLHRKFDLWKIAGVDRVKYLNDPNFSAAYNSSPVEAIRLYIAFYNGSTGNATFEVNVTTSYTAIWFDPNTQLGGSFKYVPFLRSHPDTANMVDDIMAREAEKKRQSDNATALARRYGPLSS